MLEKIREAALAYHLTRKWSKQKILTEYLNSIYFGNGAYGIESAARTYFGNDHRPPRLRQARQPLRERAASPTRPRCWPGWSPRRAPTTRSSTARRRSGGATSCSTKMLEQGYITQRRVPGARSRPRCPTARRSARRRRRRRASPRPTSRPGCASRSSTATARARRCSAACASRRRSTSACSAAPRTRSRSWLGNPPSGPQASLVAINNTTGEVRAMVGGTDYDKVPFNLATQGQRQPGSAFKPFVLATALRRGHLAGLDLGVQAAGHQRAQQHREVHRQQLRRRLLRA